MTIHCLPVLQQPFEDIHVALANSLGECNVVMTILGRLQLISTGYGESERVYGVEVLVDVGCAWFVGR
jgi:hypothetical protein